MQELKSVANDGVLLDAQNPWPGLLSFSEANQSFFFGRNQEISDLARMVAQEPLTVVFGKSGLGKSSLLNAGLAPVLRQSEFVPIYVRLDHADGAPHLADQIKARLVEVLDAEKIDAPRPQQDQTLWEYFHTKGCDWWDNENRLVRPVVICDQFEELLTIGQETPQHAERAGIFLTELEDLIDNRVPATLQKRFESERGLAKNYDFDHVGYRIVLSLREDFLADLESLHERLRPIMRNRFRLLPMSGEQAMDVILKPGAHLVDEDVAVRIVNFVSSSAGTRPTTAATRNDIASRQVEPALLSVVLRELNNRRCRMGRDRITADLVGDGQAAEILHDFYERGLSDLGQPVRDFVVDHLLTSSGARNRIAEEDARGEPGITPQAIATLIDRRIIQRVSSGNVKWLELSHDTLADVVRGSRTQHLQRREIAAAAARAAEAHRHLMRSRRLVTAFASLALLAGVFLVYAYRQNQQLKRQAEALIRAEGRLTREDDALKRAANRLDERDNTLRKDAESQADSILSSFRAELGDLKRDAGPRTIAALDWLADSASHFDSVQKRYALAAALGAEILYSYGYMLEGNRWAQKAVALSDELFKTQTPSDELRVIRAATNYSLGKGEMEKGHLIEAEGHLQTAIGLLTTIPSGPKSVHEDALHFRALAQLALGDVNAYRYSTAEARRDYQRLIDWLNQNGNSRDPFLQFCKARALLQIAKNEQAYETAKVFYRQGEMLASETIKGHPDNLSWRLQSAELASRYAKAMMDSGRLSDAARVLRDALPVAENVVSLDPRDLRSQYVLAVVDAQLGILYTTIGNTANATTFIRKAIDKSKAIGGKQTAWVINRYLTAASLYRMGDILSEKDDKGLDDRNKKRAKREQYEESRRGLEILTTAAPAFADYHRSLALANAAIGNMLSSDKDYQGALTTYDRAKAAFNRIPAPSRSAPYFQDTLAYIHTLTGYYGYVPLHRIEDARREYSKSIQIYQASSGVAPTLDEFDNLATAYHRLGNAYLEEGAYEKASDAHRAALGAYDEGLARISKTPELEGTVIQSKAQMALYNAVQWRLKRRPREALVNLKIAVETATQGLKIDPIQAGLYELLDKLNETKETNEGPQIRKLLSTSDRVAGKTESPEDISELNKQIDSLMQLARASKMLWPEGAKASKDSTVLEVEQAQSWDIPPLIPGAWLPLTDPEKKEQIDLLKAGGELEKKVVAGAIRARWLPLTFYDHARLYEIEVRRTGKSNAVFDYVRAGQNFLPLDGKSDQIHKFNGDRLRLETPEQAGQYLRFFIAAIAGSEGNFSVVDTPAELMLPASVSAAERESLSRTIVPLQPRQSTDGKWNARGTVRYSDALFYAVLKVNNFNGDVTMAHDDAIAAKQHMVSEHFVDGLRIVSDFAFRKTQLTDRVHRASSAKQWNTAIQAQRDLIRLARGNELFSEAERIKELQTEFRALSTYQLYAKDFAGALTSAEDGLKLQPTTVPLEASRAHALLFLGRTKEALDLYGKHIGEKMQPTWESLILSDLKDLRDRGLTNADAQRISSELSYLGQRNAKSGAVYRAVNAMQWSEAVKQQLSLVELERANAKVKELPDSLLGLSWYQLHTKDFSGALASVAEGLKLDPNKIELDTNRAHALVFLGRTEEAEAIYRKHMRESTSQGPWEEVILDDLKKLEADGLTHPDFARIRKMMTSGSEVR